MERGGEAQLTGQPPGRAGRQVDAAPGIVRRSSERIAQRPAEGNCYRDPTIC
jgi:hypothetical protein